MPTSSLAIAVNKISGDSANSPDRDRVDVLTAMPDALRNQRQTFQQTGGLHAAAAFNSKGEILVVHEDVGLIVSGWASFELMQKALVAGVPLLAAVSAPSGLAVRLANEFNISLVGFLRDETVNIYSAGERIT